ncbi:MAG: hypothetical protein HKN92_10495 [Chitinophagales bacterium]|nr:hypothetical protein [Chitinophagales bacterium]
MKYITLIYILSFLSPVILLAQDDFSCYIKDHNGRSREHNVDFQHMKLAVSFDLKAGKVKGNVSYQFSPLRKIVDTLLLDAIAMNIQSVKVDGASAKFRSTDKFLIIYFDRSLSWNSNHSLEISYEATPKKGLYFIGWSDPAGKSLKQIWTQGQGIDNRHWIPSYDYQNDKLTTETLITFDKEYTVISNGELLEVKDVSADEKIWHYKMTKPHVSYLVMIAAGEYDHKVMQGSNGVEIKQYYYSGMEEKFDPTYQYSVEMMDWMEEEFGVPYPWTTYANVPVQDFIYGAMENTTATIFTDYYLQDERQALERNYVGTNAHELVHQWFGDYITAWSGHHHWLHESFATHYAKTFRRHVYGDDLFNWIRFQEARSALAAGKRDNLPVAHSKAGSSRHYPKGSLVIDMMKDIVGKEQFDKVIAHFLKTHEYGMVDSHDFWQDFLDVLGINIDWFFDQWIYRGGEPHYMVTQKISNSMSTLIVEQIQDRSESVRYFTMPVDIAVYYEGNSVETTKQWISGPIDTINIPNKENKKVAFVLFDVNNKILKNIDYSNKSAKEWTNQLLMAENMIDRYLALKNLKDEKPSVKRDDYIEIFTSEKFYAIRSEIVEQLAKDSHKKSKELMLKALYDPHAYVRRAVIENIDEIDKKHLTDYETVLSDPSYRNIEIALVNLSKLTPEKKDVYLQKTAEVDGYDKNVRIAWLKIAMDSDRKYLDELIELTGPSYGFRVRSDAIDAIKNIDECNVYVLNNLSNAMTHFNRRLSRKAKDALKNICGIEDNRLKVESFYEEGEWDEDEIEAWKKIFN